MRALVAVVESGTFSAAAKQLGLSQPGVSQQIKALESELGTRLLERSGEGVKLTHHGMTAYERARTILSEWDALLSDLGKTLSPLSGTLFIGASTVPATYLLPDPIYRFRAAHPEMVIRMEVGDSKAVLSWVQEGTVDLGAVGIQPDDARLDWFAFASEQLRLIVPSHHAWAKRGSLSPADLHTGQFITRSAGSGTRRCMEAGLAHWGIQLNALQIVAELGSTEAVIGAVEVGMGVAFVSELAARQALKRASVCEVRVLAPPMARRFFLVSQRGRLNADPCVRTFSEYVRCIGTEEAV